MCIRDRSYPNAEDAERGLRDGLINEEQYNAIVEANKAGIQLSLIHI